MEVSPAGSAPAHARFHARFLAPLQPLNEIAQRLAAVPAVPVAEWADPLDDPAALHRYWEGSGGAGASPQAYEVTAWFGPARDVLDFQDFLLLGATTVLESQWALFYATGAAAPLRRVLELGRHWASEGAHLPNAIDLVVNLQAPLPPELLVRPLGSRGVSPPPRTSRAPSADQVR